MTLDGLDTSLLSADELQALERLAHVVSSDGGRIVLRRNRNYRVGRARVGNAVVTVPPPFAPDLFVTLLLYASGADLTKFAMRRASQVDLSRVPEADRFLVLMALLLVEVAEGILAQHIARAYVPRGERLRMLRGRPEWGRDFGRHPAEGITCRYHLLETDNDLNRTVLSGLVAAVRLLRGTPWASDANTQRFIWRELATDAITNPETLDTVDRGLSRLTSHYRPALQLARSLLFGDRPANLFAGSASWLQSLEFNLASLFERFLARLLGDVLAPRGLVVSPQESDRRALVDRYDETYRSVQPDVVIYRAGRPVGVVDAKFKPHYVRGSGAERLPYRNRVTSADLYQVFFYEARLRSAYGLATPLPAAIVAPVTASGLLPDRNRRTIEWNAGLRPGDPPYSIQVLAMPLEAVLTELALGTPRSALEKTPELVAFVEALL
ncbi:MAG: 5-methylcytosine restriction system specificity protein McrC [Vicinamibacteraceae bacterium]